MRASKRPRNSPAQQQDRSSPNEVLVHREERWQGPLPSPQSLEEFRKIVPDAPERIFQQWEQEAAHRRAYELTALNGAITKDRRGQQAAAAFALSALGLAGLCAWLNQPWIATILGGGTIAAVVGAFLYERRSKGSD